MKSIVFNDTTIKKNNYNDDLYDLFIHKEWINKLYHQEEFDQTKIVIHELKLKFNSYKYQDKHKHKFDIDQHITLNQIISKLYNCQLKCYYCNTDLFLFHSKKRIHNQWSLERLNNNLGHYDSNTCIACLKCNLQRRTDNYEYFKQGKSIMIEKIDSSYVSLNL
jgi:hypothetical protein